MDKLTTYKKPRLAILESKAKLRDYPQEEKNTMTLELVAKLLDMLGVGEGKIEHHKRLHGFINDAYGNYTYEEINEAFTMYVSQRFGIKPYQQLNSVVFGQVMREFDFYKKENLKLFRLEMNKPEEVTEENEELIMIEAVDRLKKEYEQHKKITSIFVHVYDYLYKKKAFPVHTKEFRDKISERAKIIAKSDAMTEAGRDYNAHRFLKQTLEMIENGQGDSLATISKRLVLEDYFKDKINSDNQ